MKTIYLKSQPVQSWQLPVYYKLTGSDFNITEISVWDAKSVEIYECDDETLEERSEWIKTHDSNHPAIEITREEFDKQYSKLTNKLNELAAA